MDNNDFADPPDSWPTPVVRSPPPTQASELAAARRNLALADRWARFARRVQPDSRWMYIDMAEEHYSKARQHEANSRALKMEKT